MIPASVDPPDEFQTPFSFTLDDGIDEARGVLVGFVARFGAGVSDREILNAESAELAI